MSRRLLLLLVRAALLAGAIGAPWAMAQGADSGWIAAWTAAAQDLRRVFVPPGQPGPADAQLVDQTLRQRVQPAQGGSWWRVRFSNRYGTAPLRIGAATVARAAGAAAAPISAPAGTLAAGSGAGADQGAVVAATLRPLRFAGRLTLTLAPGAEAWSDPFTLPVAAGQSLTVSYFLPGTQAADTVHQLPPQATLAQPGNAVAQPRLNRAAPLPWNHAVTGLELRGAPSGTRVVAAFGDSITHGGTTSYPAQLNALWQRTPPRRGNAALPMAVLNAGLGGNRLLNDGAGPSALSRFTHDVLAQPGLSHVIVLIGINDIGYGTVHGVRMPGLPARQLPSVEALAEGLRELVVRAHARGVKVVLGTLTPFGDADYWNEDNEAQRQTLNAWIRDQRLADAVVDFDVALRDSAHPTRMAAADDSGDHLHPGPAGQAAMAQAVAALPLWNE